jgi:hypothetical protein
MDNVSKDFKPVAVETSFEQYDFRSVWKEPFIQATFFNEDLINPMFVNNKRVAPNSALEITLLTMQVNTSKYIITSDSATRDCFIIYSTYRDWEKL